MVQLVNNTHIKTKVNYRSDAPHRISMEDRLDPEQVKPIQDQLEAAIQLADPNKVNKLQKEVTYELIGAEISQRDFHAELIYIIVYKNHLGTYLF